MAEKRKNAGKSNLLSSAQEITKDETIQDEAPESPTTIANKKDKHSPLLTRHQLATAAISGSSGGLNSSGGLKGSGGILKNSGTGPTRRELSGSSSLKKEVLFVDSPTTERKKKPRNVLTASMVLNRDSKYIYFRIAAALLIIVFTYTAWSAFNTGSGKPGFKPMPALVLQHIDNGSYLPVHDREQSYRIFYRDNQRRGGEPVILLHDIGSSSFTYRKVLTELSNNGLHGISFDFPGQGLSESPTKAKLTWRYYADTIKNVLDAFQMKKAHFVFHGTSAAIGLDFAARNPTKIKSLTFVAPILDVESFAVPFPLSLFSIPYINKISARVVTSTIAAPFNWLLFRLRGSNRVTQEEVAAYTYLMVHTEAGQTFIQAIEGANTSSSFQSHISSTLSSLSVPSQLIDADDDVYGTSQEFFTKHNKAATVHTIQSKHLVPEDRPKELSKHITIFVNQVSPPAPQVDHTHTHGSDHHGHSHSHSGDHHGHSHSHGSDHGHSHSHGSDHAHSHSHGSDHGHSHSHESDHGHSHSHDSGDHGHSHGHHDCPGSKMMGGHNYGL